MDVAVDTSLLSSTTQALKPKVSSFSGEFSDVLKQNLSETNALLNKADNMVQSYSKTKSLDLHEVMIAVEEANVAFSYTMQVRNKLIEGYQEMMRIQV